MPLETSCEHYFCTTCFSRALEATQLAACPVCKTDLNDLQIKPATRIVMRLIGELKIECNRCKCELNYEDSGHHICFHTPPVIAQPVLTPAAAPRAPPAQPAAPTLEDAFEQLRQGKVSPEVEKLGTMLIKSKMKLSADGKSALLRTQGKVTVTIFFFQLTLGDKFGFHFKT